MKIFIIAGEASGDLHGSQLMREIKKINPSVEFQFTGGDLMMAEGGTLIRHYRHMSFMGIIEVLAHLKIIAQNFKICKKAILHFQPDALLLIDYPGFNLRMAKWAKKHNIRCFMYNSPTVWAWKENRIDTIKRCIEKLFVILPFEVDFYNKHNYQVEFTGYPIFDVIEDFKEHNYCSEFRKENGLNEKPIVALLAGSRKQEIIKCLPVMLTQVDKHPDYQFVIAGASSLSHEIYEPLIATHKNVKIVFGKTYALLSNAHTAIVTSGTATMETAFMKVPQLVIYKTIPLSYFIGSRIVKVKFFTLVNLILNRMAVKEFLQHNLESRVDAELSKLLQDNEYRKTILNSYDELRNMMKRGAYQRTAEKLYSLINTKQ